MNAQTRERQRKFRACEQARELIQQIGNGRDKLNAAASKLFRKQIIRYPF